MTVGLFHVKRDGDRREFGRPASVGWVERTNQNDSDRDKTVGGIAPTQRMSLVEYTSPGYQCSNCA